MGVLIRGRPSADVYDEGVIVNTRPALNFVGAGVAATDDAANDRITVTIPGGGGSLTVQEDTVVVDAAVTVLNFTEPDGVLVTSAPAGQANIAMGFYAKLLGRAGGQSLAGGTAASENLTLDSTAHATKGAVVLASKLRMAASPNNIVQDSAGATRITVATAVPNVTLAGDCQIGGNNTYTGIGTAPDDAATPGGAALTVRCPGIEGTGSGYVYGIQVTTSGTTPRVGNAGGQFVGVIAAASINVLPATNPTNVEALNFYNALIGGAGSTLVEMNGVVVYPVYCNTFTGTVTTARGVKVVAPNVTNSNTSVWSNVIGVDIANVGHARVVNATGLRIANITAASGNLYLIEALGATNPNLRVEAADPTNPGALKGRSRALAQFNENGALALRRVEWVDSGVAGAGIPNNSKVLVGI